MPSLTVQSPLGPLLVTEEDGAITEITWAEEGAEDSLDETPVLLDARRQLDEYFAGDRSVFDLPLAPAGTEFEKKVWDQLLAIPYGEVKQCVDTKKALLDLERGQGQLDV